MVCHLNCLNGVIQPLLDWTLYVGEKRDDVACSKQSKQSDSTYVGDRCFIHPRRSRQCTSSKSKHQDISILAMGYPFTQELSMLPDR